MHARDVKRGAAVQVTARDGETIVGDGKVTRVDKYDASGLITIEYEVTVRRRFGPFQAYDQAKLDGTEVLD